MYKQTFTPSNVESVIARMSRNNNHRVTQSASTMVSAKIIREAGFSREKMNGAYRLAQIAVGLQN
ncbi:hypothetical protein [Massilia eurypsychrophila]|jgi:hypothetical protein|uniref:hypothetical protein n=1 Tax=Massilia eurypsychrophila TaxID=1485217 RepID=UPI00103502C7|nr:hypothetical protein [Massilia eurypsychrophila]